MEGDHYQIRFEEGLMISIDSRILEKNNWKFLQGTFFQKILFDGLFQDNVLLQQIHGV